MGQHSEGGGGGAACSSRQQQVACSVEGMRQHIEGPEGRAGWRASSCCRVLPPPAARMSGGSPQ